MTFCERIKSSVTAGICLHQSLWKHLFSLILSPLSKWWQLHFFFFFCKLIFNHSDQMISSLWSFSRPSSISNMSQVNGENVLKISFFLSYSISMPCATKLRWLCVCILQSSSKGRVFVIFVEHRDGTVWTPKASWIWDHLYVPSHNTCFFVLKDNDFVSNNYNIKHAPKENK